MNWWRLACEPVAEGRIGEPDVELAGEGHAAAPSIEWASFLADPRRGGRHDVEVAGIRRQVVAASLDFEQDRDPPAALGDSSNCGTERSR